MSFCVVGFDVDQSSPSTGSGPPRHQQQKTSMLSKLLRSGASDMPVGIDMTEDIYTDDCTDEYDEYCEEAALMSCSSTATSASSSPIPIPHNRRSRAWAKARFQLAQQARLFECQQQQQYAQACQGKGATARPGQRS